MAVASPPASERYTEMMMRYLGPRIVDAFRADDITEVYINPNDYRVRYDTRSRGRIDSGLTIDPVRVEMFLNAVATALGETLGGAQPFLEAELPAAGFRGSRLLGFIAPAASGPGFVARKRASTVYTLADYVASGTLTTRQGAALARAVDEHWNLVIAGGTNSGKTTLANALLSEVARRYPDERIVVLEDTVELQCPARDTLALRSGPTVTLRDLVRRTLRANPDRIIVGEVRGAEALDLLDAWATGHPGGVATVHASSALGALRRFDRLAQRANVPSQAVLIAETVHVIVVMRGSPVSRRVSELVRVAGLTADGQYLLHPLLAEDASV
jgi:P-type conjugative transfer ATPase TrbB